MIGEKSSPADRESECGHLAYKAGESATRWAKSRETRQRHPHARACARTHKQMYRPLAHPSSSRRQRARQCRGHGPRERAARREPRAEALRRHHRRARRRRARSHLRRHREALSRAPRAPADAGAADDAAPAPAGRGHGLRATGEQIVEPAGAAGEVTGECVCAVRMHRPRRVLHVCMSPVRLRAGRAMRTG